MKLELLAAGGVLAISVLWGCNETPAGPVPTPRADDQNAYRPLPMPKPLPPEGDTGMPMPPPQPSPGAGTMPAGSGGGIE